MSIVLLVYFISCCTILTAEPNHTNDVQTKSATILSKPSFKHETPTVFDTTMEEYIEIGTPASFRAAVHYFSAANKNKTAGKQFYLTLIAKLMEFLYPLEKSNWYSHTLKGSNNHLEAIAAVEQGRYPQTSAMNTFLETIIPTLIVLRNNDIGIYEKDIEKRLYRARDINPRAVLPFYILGALYELQSNFTEAENAYKTAWERDNSCYPAGIQLARLFLQHQNAEQAFPIAKTLDERFPQTLAVQTILAEAYYAINALPEAYALLQEIQKKGRNTTALYFLHIRILLKQKEFLQAAALLDSYAKKNKTDKNYLLLRAEILNEWNKNIVEAKRYIETAEQLYPHEADVLLACAAFCFEANETINGKTVNDFITMLLKQGYSNISAMRLLIKQDIAQEQWTSAFDRALYLHKTYPSQEHTALYIKACIGLQKWAEAAATAKKAYYNTETPSDTMTALYLETLAGTKDYTTLTRIIDKRLPQSRSSLKAILLYYQAHTEKNDEKKLSLLRLSLLSDPRSVPTLFSLYEWYFSHDDYRKAQYYLQQVVMLEPANRRYQALTEKLERILAK